MKRSFIYRTIAFILSCTMALTGCAKSSDSSSSTVSSTVQTTAISAEIPAAAENELEKLDIESLDDPDLSRYIEDALYEELVTNIDSDDYYIENIETSYISKEYLDELEYNSKQNVFFGYTLAELDEQFQGEKYVFTLNENGETVVQPFEKYDDTYIKALKNFAIGTGVILVCVTVSALTAGAPPVSYFFASAADKAIDFAINGAFIGGLDGIKKYIETGDIEESLKCAALNGSEYYKAGAFIGAATGGIKSSFTMHRATRGGLSLSDAAKILKEVKLPARFLKQISSMDEYNEIVLIAENSGITINTLADDCLSEKISVDVLSKCHSLDEAKVYNKADLFLKTINDSEALVRKIDTTKIVDDMGRTNLQRMFDGLSPLDEFGKPYELHHIGQEIDSPLAILTSEEHHAPCLHWNVNTENPSSLPGWTTQKKQFWKSFAEMIEKGAI